MARKAGKCSLLDIEIEKEGGVVEENRREGGRGRKEGREEKRRKGRKRSPFWRLYSFLWHFLVC